MARDVLCLSHLRWGFVFQRPNHLMSRCARDSRVFFVEEPVFDGTEAPRLSLEEVMPRLFVVVPRLREGTSAADSELLVRGLLDRLVRDRAIRDPLLWFYTPMALGFARHLKRSAVVYDCMDELTGFDGAPKILRERERELFDIADIVFTGGQSLYEAKRQCHDNVHAFPSSVDAAHFASAMHAEGEPLTQESIPHPRVGFFGVIDERMDLALVRDVASLRPNIQFVMIGPVVKISPDSLPRLPNIHYLGPKTYAELPRYLAAWDVAFMPFALNAATRFISPTKTLEYLSAGKPVVSTPIHDVVRPYGEQGLVRITRTALEMAAMIDETLAEQSTIAGAARRAACAVFVAGTSWDRTWDAMHTMLRDIPRGMKATREVVETDQETPCSTT